MFQMREKIQQDFEAITKQLLRCKNDPKRFNRLNRQRSEQIKRARRLGVELKHV